MIKSMTGFGRSEYSDGKRNIICEIRSVNHRYSDITVKMPRRYSFAEDKIKQTVKEKLVRGKVDVSINVENLTENDVVIKLNQLAAGQYYENLKELKEQFGLSGEIDLSLMAGMPDVLKAVPDVEDEDELTKAILVPVAEASANLEKMRAIEGARLADDLIKKGETIKGILDQIEERSPLVVKDYMEKLRARIAELLDGAAEIPEDRILTEAAIFADKCAIDEEITRLNSHLLQLKSILTGSESTVGKKLDFLVQEMNREANTIGSKANDITITNHMLNIKSEIEKIREQVQNIE
ncbi:MAG: YicC family protein [Firmicutes bacterium]|nr:YicC family protein [Clostridiales bacterium]MBQ5955279.1 YicC family protein [Bacillota bacterium]MBQ6089043.1 YicC family protein [Bacillota bacterium]MBR3260822.1 YicC family protein [Bacillota bacterium]MBR3375130.1 YicC family protein [Bacillota bacterium]